MKIVLTRLHWLANTEPLSCFDKLFFWLLDWIWINFFLILLDMPIWSWCSESLLCGNMSFLTGFGVLMVCWLKALMKDISLGIFLFVFYFWLGSNFTCVHLYIGMKLVEAKYMYSYADIDISSSFSVGMGEWFYRLAKLKFFIAILFFLLWGLQVLNSLRVLLLALIYFLCRSPS